ncbi:thymidylate synthase [Candidatus Bathyarchaeota archaeon]|nr:thymidylate synthase [Candidatus Bathyarchaeota archaeon]
MVLELLFIYGDAFGERVIRNLINDPSFCQVCGLYCDFCKAGKYGHVSRIRGALRMPSPEDLPSFLEKPEAYLPKKVPKADLCVISGIHPDLLLAMPGLLAKAGIKGLIVPIEDFRKVPSGLRRQVSEACQDLGLESVFPKPFCNLEAPREENAMVSSFIEELGIGRPVLRIDLRRSGSLLKIRRVSVLKSAPCGSTWYVAKKIEGLELEAGSKVSAKECDALRDAVARAHHSYPCTASMEVDPELGEPILHKAGHTVLDAVARAIDEIGDLWMKKHL